MSKKEKSSEYSRLKKSLEVLGYNEPLGLDSVVLANRLLNDLTNTTEAFKKIKDEKEKLSLELKNQGNIILPLRNENMRITKENNDLHNQMIQLEDNLDKFKLVNNEYNKKVEKERDDFKILLNQKENQIKKQQNEIDLLKKKVTDLFDQINFKQTNLYKTSSNNMYTKNNKSTFINIGAIDISENLAVPQNNDNPVDLFKNELNNFNINKESWANDLKLADKEAEKLRNEIRGLRKQLEQKEKIIQNFKNQIDFRDNEINKLQLNKFVGDNNIKELQLKYDSENIKIENDKLKAQIDILNEENHKLQEKEHFHSHRCREDEIKNLENIINKLQKENNSLQKSNIDIKNQIKNNAKKEKSNENNKKAINK